MQTQLHRTSTMYSSVCDVSHLQIIAEIRESKYSTESGLGVTGVSQQHDHLAKEDAGQAATKNTSSSSMPEHSRTDQCVSSEPKDSAQTPVTSTDNVQMQSAHLVRSTFRIESAALDVAEKHHTFDDSWNLSPPACLDAKEPKLVSREPQLVLTEPTTRADSEVSGQPGPSKANTSAAEPREEEEEEEERELMDAELPARRRSAGDGGRPVMEKPEQKCQGVGERQERDPDCTECRLVRPDPTHQELVMYLHALSYKVQRSPLPQWKHVQR